MSDRELLELAAKAAGYEFDSTDPFEICVPHKGGNNFQEWNPLIDDGDALRLAMKLELKVTAGCAEKYGGIVAVCEIVDWPDEDVDICAATRRAIVRAAAEIGRNLP